MRAPLHREATIRLRVDDDSGALVAPDSTPTLTVTDQNGSSVTAGAVSSASVGLYEAVIPGRSVLGTLTCQWGYAVSGSARTTTDVVSVTEKRLVPLWRLREADELDSLSAVNMLRLADTIEDWLTSALGFPVVEVFAASTVRVPQDSQHLRIDRVWYPTSVRAVTIDGQAVADAEAEPLGFFREAGWSKGDLVRISYEHGPSPDFLNALPGDIERAAIILARYANRTTNYPERARQIATEGSLITFSTPSPDRPTGLPEVDSIVSRYQVRTIV